MPPSPTVTTLFAMPRRRFLLVIACLILAACASKPPNPSSEPPRESVAELTAKANLTDGRGRFREIFCAVMNDHGEDLPDYRSCEEALSLVEPEPISDGKPVYLGTTREDYLILIVPGLGWDCFENWLDQDSLGEKHIAALGYEVELIDIDGLSSTTNNAIQIRDYVAGLSAAKAERPLILIGYSKGAPDIMEAVATYPEFAKRVTAVISLAGSVGGSPLADDASQGQANLLTMAPGAECDKGDEGAVESLKPAVRRKWLAENPMPEHIRLYSVVTYPEPERVSRALRSGYQFLSGMDVRNDTQVLIYDQMIPNSTLVAFVNADHWAIAVPIARTHEWVASLFVDQNDYPREAFLEALLRYVEEDLSPK
jgi:pimeloyl-ACP methyl ester carboxylesterase